MKKIFILICTLFIAVNVSAQTRKVGDIIMINGEFGVVFAVTTDGRHGKALSVSETKCNWDNAKTWCANLGPAWKLPTIDELRVIYRNKAVINSALLTNGYTTFLSYLYWSSESHNEEVLCAWTFDMVDVYTMPNTNLEDWDVYVRAVSAF